MALMELMVGEQESRTGITRLNQGLDADAMNKTATGMASQSAQGAQIEQFVARNFADAMARLFAKKLRLMISEGDSIVSLEVLTSELQSLIRIVYADFCL